MTTAGDPWLLDVEDVALVNPRSAVAQLTCAAEQSAADRGSMTVFQSSRFGGGRGRSAKSLGGLIS
jgi:hypothetical protein